ncbi:MAG: ferric reductase-like transmembrane domain-containing protein, partial [Actinomycetota bacterium]
MSTVIAPPSRAQRPTVAMSRPTPRAVPLAGAATTRAVDSDVAVFIGFLFAVVTGVWAVNDGWSTLTSGWDGFWRGSASLSGILTSVSAMTGLLLAARIPWMERALGLDRVLIWHRIAGDTMGLLLGVHVFTAVVADVPLRGGLVDTVLDLTGREPYMALTAVGAAIIGVVVVTSLQNIRNKMSYETWYFVHLTAYVGIVISYSHQIT